MGRIFAKPKLEASSSASEGLSSQLQVPGLSVPKEGAADELALLGPPSALALHFLRASPLPALRLFSTNRETLPRPTASAISIEFYDDDDDLGPINANDDVRLRCNDWRWPGPGPR